MAKRRAPVATLELFEPDAPAAVLELAQTPAPVAPAASASLAVVEVLSLAAAMLARLPAPSTLSLSTATGAVWFATTCESTYTTLRQSGHVVLTGRELALLALAAEHGRASRVWLAQWLEQRRATPSLRLDAADVLGGVSAPDDELPKQPWPLSRVLHAYACKLDAVAVGEVWL